MGGLTRIAGFGAATALLAPSATAATGDRAGLALLGRIHRAYADVPGVSVTGQTGQLQFRWKIALDSGINVGEYFFAESPGGVTELVARQGGPTYAHNPGTSCWQELGKSDRQTLANVGLRFPDQAGMKVGAPRTVSGGSVLPVTAAGDPGTFSLDRSARVRSITVSTGGRSIFERVTTLQSRPALPQPEPRC
jgi:hypothetical protein